MPNNTDIIEEARTRLQLCVNAEREIREEAEADMRYVLGDQWDPEDRKRREDAGRPVVTIDKISGSVQQLVNDGRQQRPAIKVSALGQGAKKDTADVIKGIVRHIEHVSRADVAYDTALESAANCSFGSIRVTTQYCDDQSFDQEIRIERIEDAFSVYFDPAAMKHDRSDAMYCFVRQWLTREAYEERYGEAPAKADFVLTGDNWFTAGGTASEDKIAVAEYWKVETEPKTLYLLSDGRVSDRKPDGSEVGESNQPITVVDRREIKQRKVRQYILNGLEQLDETEWKGSRIPIIPVFGKEITVKGVRHLISMARKARDPQKVYNYVVSAEVEEVGRASKTPYVGAVGQFNTKRQDWRDANTVPMAFLEYDPVEGASAPQRSSVEPPIQAYSILRVQASDDLKATIGYFDPSLGNVDKSERSGIALQTLQAKGSLSNFHFLDNLARAICSVGEVIVELIPLVYTTAREVRIIGTDDAEKVVLVNKIWKDEAGNVNHYQLGVGKYDAAVEVGPSYATKQKEASDGMAGLAKAAPQLLPRWIDLFVKALDWPMKDEIAARLVPADIAQSQLQTGQNVPAAQVQALLQQHAQVVQELQHLKMVIETKQVETQSRERVAWLEAQTRMAEAKLKLIEAEMRNAHASQIEALKIRAQQVEADLGRAHDVRMASAGQTARTGGAEEEGPAQSAPTPTPLQQT